MATQTIIERENSSGTVSFKGKLINWRKTDGYNVTINLGQVAVIGEYTTDRGPFADDWFLVFVFKGGEWEKVSVYAEGFQELVQFLSQRFNIDFAIPFLTNGTEWKSFVRYPQNLEAKELFRLTPPRGYKPPTTILQNMKVALGLGVYGKDWEVQLADEVKVEIAKASG